MQCHRLTDNQQLCPASSANCSLADGVLCILLLLSLQGATDGRYQPSAVDLVNSANALSGAVHYVRIAQQECKRQLSKAVKAFQPFSVTTGTEQGQDENEDDVLVDSEDMDAYVPPASADDTA